jgi:hypothetical protein
LAFRNLQAAECIEADPALDERNSRLDVEKVKRTPSSDSIPHTQKASFAMIIRYHFAGDESWFV